MAAPKPKSSAASSRAAPNWAGKRIERHRYAPNAAIFAQGDAATSVMFVERGVVRLSVVSHAGKEAIVGMLDAGQEILAEMIGTTRTRVNFFMNKFRKLGLIEYDHQDGVRVNNSLLGVVLKD